MHTETSLDLSYIATVATRVLEQSRSLKCQLQKCILNSVI